RPTLRRPPTSTLFPYTTLFRSIAESRCSSLFGFYSTLVQSGLVQVTLHQCIGAGAMDMMMFVLLIGLLVVLVWIICIDRRLRLRSEEHTSELQSRFDLVCRLLP